MKPISSDLLVSTLQQWVGEIIYIHIEINPGGYFRNGKATLERVHVKGNNSYRIYLELERQEAIIHVDDLTHMSLEEDLVIVTGYDDHQRLARTLEISLKPFEL
jgi:hypothetical protein